MRGLADENLSRCGGLLEARRHVHGLTGCKRRVGLVDHHLARLDTDSRLETEIADMIENPETGPDGAVGVVLVRAWDPERGHHGVAGELLDGAAVRLDAALDAVEEGRHAPARDLGILARDELGRRDQVSEQDCCELPFHRLNSMERRSRSGEARGAVGTRALEGRR